MENIDLDLDSDAELAAWHRRARYWRLPALGGLELLRADFSTQRFRRHWHPGYAIGVVTRGLERFRCRGRHHLAGPASLIAVNPGELHDGESAATGGWRYRMIYPSEELMTSVARDLRGDRASAPALRSPVLPDPDLAAAFLDAHRAAEGRGEPLRVETGLLGVLAALVQRHSDAAGTSPSVPREPGRLRRVLDLIDADLAADLSLDALAAAADLNRFHLVRTFKRVVGMTPHAYVTERRVRRGKALLARGIPVAEVAVAVGFFDQSHFATRFRETYGMTPRIFQLGSARAR